MRHTPMSPAVGRAATSARPLSPVVGARPMPPSPLRPERRLGPAFSPSRASSSQTGTTAPAPPSVGLLELRRAAQSLRVQHDAASLDGLRAALERERAIVAMRPVFSPPPRRQPSAIPPTAGPAVALDELHVATPAARISTAHEVVELQQTVTLLRDTLAARDATIARLQGEAATLRATAADAHVVTTQASARDAVLSRELAELRTALDNISIAHDAERSRADALARAVTAYTKRERAAVLVGEADARAALERAAADGTAQIAAAMAVAAAVERRHARGTDALQRVLASCDALTRELAAAHAIARDAAASREASDSARHVLGDAVRTHASFVLSATGNWHWQALLERDEELQATVQLLRASASALVRLRPTR